MAEPIRVSGPVSGTDKTLSFETGKLAPQSQGAVVASIGSTTVLTTANAARDVRPGIDFFPLTVDVEERAYAAGKIPGSFFRREGRPTEDAILTCRLTDRPLRPSFADGFRNETQIVTTVIGADQENPHDVLSINAASAALMISGIPFEGPIGSVRIAFTTDGEWTPHPTFEESDASVFELVVAGRELEGGDVAIMMVEAGGTPKSFTYYAGGAKKVDEAVLASGLDASKTWIKESIQLQRQLVASVIATHGPIEPLPFTPVSEFGADVLAAVERVASDDLAKAVTISLKQDRNAAIDAAGDAAIVELCGTAEAPGEFAGREREIKDAVLKLTKKLVRKRIVDEGVRIDGRGVADLRPVSAEVGVLPTAHGSGLFQRGETQVLNVCTLAMPRMNQLLDTLTPETQKRYLHHYNMPPWANGEVGRVGSPKRREIGHGALAARAVLPVVPSQEEFAYTLRLVSEVLASNGSTSMASVCSSSLSLMDAGVPIKAPVAGIAMGLVFEGGTYTTLTDILGAEDAFGDMDFKVAGTADAITALQLDTKIDGIPADVLTAALEQAKVARLEILEVMNAAISTPRTEVAATAPKITSLTIPLDKVGEVIGPKGKVINTIQSETGADISVDDDGVQGIVTIGAVESWRMEEAKAAILAIVDPPKAELGRVYNGRVVNITKFGAFVNILPGRDGLVHISKLGGGKRIAQVEDVLQLGQEIEVRVDEIDDKGKVSLTPTSDGTPAGEPSVPAAVGAPATATESAPRSGGGDVVSVSFEETFDSELRSELGDLGPSGERGGDAGRNDRGPRPRTSPSSLMSETITRLDNGLTIATDRVQGARSVAIGVWVGVGSRDEPAAQSGVSHFLEHLLFKGTPTRSATDISRSVDRVGGDINAFTAKEYTSFYCRMPARHGGAGIELLGDVIARSTLHDDDVESERQVILEELAMDDDSPDDVALRTLTRQLFPDHGLGRDTAGDRDTVRSITAADIRRFHAEHYTTGSTVVAVAGEIDHDDILDAVATAFVDLPAGDGRVPRELPGPHGENVGIDDDSEQVHLAVGGRSVQRDDPDREVLDVVNHVFGGGLSSRLFDEIRERRGLAYSVYSANSSYADVGAWSVYAGAMPEHAGDVERLIHTEIERLVSGGITAEELEVAVGYLTGAYQLGLEDTAARMSRLGGMLITLGKVHSVEEQLSRWENVTLDDAKRAITEVFGAAAPITVSVGPAF